MRPALRRALRPLLALSLVIGVGAAARPASGPRPEDVPPPASLALLGSGAALLTLFAARRRG